MEAIERTFLSEDWVTLVFLCCFVLLAIVKLHNPERLLGFYIAFFTQGFIKKNADETTSFFSVFYILSFLFTSIIISLIIRVFIFQKTFFDFLAIISIVSLYLLMHFFIVFLISKTFELQETIRYFLLTKIGYLFTICLCIFPLLILHHYRLNNLIVFSVFIGVLLLFRAFLILKNNKKLIFNQLFYFILYLCTLELAPLLIIYKITTP